MMKKFLLPALALAWTAQPAMAARFSFDFNVDVNGDTMRGSGTLDAEDIGQGHYGVTGGTGTFYMWEGDEPRTVTRIFGGFDRATGEQWAATLFRTGGGWMTHEISFDTVGAQDQTFWFGDGQDGRYNFWVTEVGARNVAFNINPIADAVPEPATWALMLVGFGAVGAAMRRNRRVATSVRLTA